VVLCFVVPFYFLLDSLWKNLAKEISMSSFVSCSVNGLSPSCFSKIGSNHVSLITLSMIPVYLLGAVIGILVENKEFLYSSNVLCLLFQNVDATSTFLLELLPSQSTPLEDPAFVRSACLKTFSFGMLYFLQISWINHDTVAL
jgi:hypothetical protein